MLFLIILIIFVIFLLLLFHCHESECIYDCVIVSAFNLEIIDLLKYMKIKKKITRLDRELYIARYKNKNIILCLTGQGLVNAAMTCQYLIDNFKFNMLVFSGIAGGIEEYLNLGDVVVGSSFAQIDYQKFIYQKDTAPNFPLLYVGIQFQCDENIGIVMETEYFKNKTVNSTFLYNRNIKHIPELPITEYKVYTEGIVLSSSQFAGNKEYVKKLRETEYNFVAIDMESSAVANVCLQNNKQFVVIRGISDKADSPVVEDIETIVKNVSDYTLKFIDIL